MNRRPSRRRSGWSAFSGAARIGLVVLSVLILVVGAAFTAANILPATNVDDQTLPDRPVVPTPPSECSGITTTNTVSGTGVVAGTDQNDWLIGSEAIDTLSGFGGDDCIEGRDGADVIEGGLGNDVCIGGPGIDTFVGCETQIQ